VALSRSAGPTFSLAVPPGGGGTGTLGASAPALAAGASATFALAVKANAGGPRGSALGNTANVTSTTADPNPADDGPTATAAVTTLADLAVATTGPAAVTAGADATYALSVTNNGPGDPQAVQLTDALRGGPSFASAGAGGGVGASFSASLGTLAAVAGRTVTRVALVSPGGPAGPQVADDVLATGTTPGAANTHHTAAAVSTAQAQADPPVTLTAPGGEESDRVEGQGWAAEQQATPLAGMLAPPTVLSLLRDGPEGASL
jgi:uncharacterized repeat protein (TIGR01451 family)